jgi:hypothetical protein
MKKVFALMVTAMLGIATASAQTLLAEANNDQTTNTILYENIESKTIVDSCFDAIKGASFLTEEEQQLLIDQLSDNPNQVAAGVLSILLGDIGVGHFYTGQTLRGVLDILFCWTGVPAIIGLVEGIIWLCDSEEAWSERVAKWNSN